MTAYHNGKSQHQDIVQAWRESTEALRVFDRNDHPDITDRFGRVWVWYHEDTYIHDGDTACLKKFIPTDDERTA